MFIFERLLEKMMDLALKAKQHFGIIIYTYAILPTDAKW